MKNSSYLQVFDDFEFSEQEKNVCLWLCNGHSYTEIGKRLGLSAHTVKNYMHKAKFRLYSEGHRVTTKLDFISLIMSMAVEYE